MSSKPTNSPHPCHEPVLEQIIRDTSVLVRQVGKVVQTVEMVNGESCLHLWFGKAQIDDDTASTCPVGQWGAATDSEAAGRSEMKAF